MKWMLMTNAVLAWLVVGCGSGGGQGIAGEDVPVADAAAVDVVGTDGVSPQDAVGGDAGGQDATQEDAVVASGGCHDDGECPQGEACAYPGAPQACGVCFHPSEESFYTVCDGDGDCTESEVCVYGSQYTGPDCFCELVKVCKPACTETSCGKWSSCGPDGRCHANPCETSEQCPSSYACIGNDCHRMSCDSDDDCSGYCVMGSCYDEPGECRPPAA